MDVTAKLQEATAKPRLHPLLTAAAISVTVFSAVGVAAITGLLPTSRSTTKESAPVTAEAPAPQAAQAQAEPAAPAAAPAMPAAPAATPAPRPAKKRVAHAAAPKLVQVPAPVPEMPQIAANMPPPPPAPVAQVEPPRPIIDPTLGVVQAVREVTHTPKTNGLGPIAGGVAGALLGNQVGHGTGRSVATVLGTVGGALVGTEVETKTRETKTWEITVRLDDGSTRTISSSSAPIWHGGERVRLVEGQLRPA